jgi:hypothetical protein
MQPREEPIATGAGESQGTEEATRYQPRAADTKQKGKIPPPDLPPDDTAIPVSYRLTSTGKVEPVKHDLDLTKAPLIAGKHPPEIPPGKKGESYPNDFEHVDFLSKPDQQKLTHVNDASAVTTYADKLWTIHTHEQHSMSDTIMARNPGTPTY